MSWIDSSPSRRTTSDSKSVKSVGPGTYTDLHIGVGERQSPYISLTRDYEVAKAYNRNPTPIVEIDLSRVPSPVIDFTDPANLATLKNPAAIYNASRDAEVLVRGPIPPEAIIRIYYPDF